MSHDETGVNISSDGSTGVGGNVAGRDHNTQNITIPPTSLSGVVIALTQIAADLGGLVESFKAHDTFLIETSRILIQAIEEVLMSMDEFGESLDLATQLAELKAIHDRIERKQKRQRTRRAT